MCRNENGWLWPKKGLSDAFLKYITQPAQLKDLEPNKIQACYYSCCVMLCCARIHNIVSFYCSKMQFKIWKKAHCYFFKDMSFLLKIVTYSCNSMHCMVIIPFMLSYKWKWKYYNKNNIKLFSFFLHFFYTFRCTHAHAFTTPSYISKQRYAFLHSLTLFIHSYLFLENFFYFLLLSLLQHFTSLSSL